MKDLPKRLLTLLLVWITFLLTSCFLFLPSTSASDTPSPRALQVGDRVGSMTIVWENTHGGSWKFLAMGTPSEKNAVGSLYF